MEARRETREERLTQWSEIFRLRQESGQTIRKYCEINGINERHYYYWQRQKRAIASTSLTTRQEETPNGWAKYSPAVSNVATADLSIEINGCLIHINERVAPELLRQTCRVLRTLC